MDSINIRKKLMHLYVEKILRSEQGEQLLETFIETYCEEKHISIGEYARLLSGNEQAIEIDNDHMNAYPLRRETEIIPLPLEILKEQQNGQKEDVYGITFTANRCKRVYALALTKDKRLLLIKGDVEPAKTVFHALPLKVHPSSPSGKEGFLIGMLPELLSCLSDAESHFIRNTLYNNSVRYKEQYKLSPDVNVIHQYLLKLMDDDLAAEKIENSIIAATSKRKKLIRINETILPVHETNIVASDNHTRNKDIHFEGKCYRAKVKLSLLAGSNSTDDEFYYLVKAHEGPPRKRCHYFFVIIRMSDLRKADENGTGASGKQRIDVNIPFVKRNGYFELDERPKRKQEKYIYELLGVTAVEDEQYT